MSCNKVVKNLAYLQNSKLPLTRSLESLRKVMWIAEILFLRRVCLSLSVDQQLPTYLHHLFQRGVTEPEGIHSDLRTFKFFSTFNVEGRPMSTVSLRRPTHLRSRSSMSGNQFLDRLILLNKLNLGEASQKRTRGWI